MNALATFVNGTNPCSDAPDLARVIDAIGHPGFELEFLVFLHAVSGAEHCTMFRVGSDSFTVVAAASLDGAEIAYRQANLYAGGQYWRRDPAILEARRRTEPNGPSLVRVRIDDIPDTDLRDKIYRHHPVAERLVICGRRVNDDFGLSILRNERHGRFADDDVCRLTDLSNTLLSLLQKHAEYADRRRGLAPALASVSEIERHIEFGAPHLPRRERQVCAGILSGQTTGGIALDLDIGQESVATYRKRAYERLGLGSRHELLHWYLDLWSGMAAH